MHNNKYALLSAADIPNTQVQYLDEKCHCQYFVHCLMNTRSPKTKSSAFLNTIIQNILDMLSLCDVINHPTCIDRIKVK